MKKRIRVGFLLFAILIFLTSCGKSSDNELIGSWKSKDSNLMMEFNADGEFVMGSLIGEYRLKKDNMIELLIDGDKLNKQYRLEGDRLDWGTDTYDPESFFREIEE